MSTRYRRCAIIRAVFLADWSLANSGRVMAQLDLLQRIEGITLVDYLDIAGRVFTGRLTFSD